MCNPGPVHVADGTLCAFCNILHRRRPTSSGFICPYCSWLFRHRSIDCCIFRCVNCVQISDVSRPTSAPLIVSFATIFLTTHLICGKFRFECRFISVQSFAAANNNFELAVAVAISTFGADGNQALAATVRPLVEIPVLLALVDVMRVLGQRWK